MFVHSWERELVSSSLDQVLATVVDSRPPPHPHPLTYLATINTYLLIPLLTAEQQQK